MWRASRSLLLLGAIGLAGCGVYGACAALEGFNISSDSYRSAAGTTLVVDRAAGTAVFSYVKDGKQVKESFRIK